MGDGVCGASVVTVVKIACLERGRIGARFLEGRGCSVVIARACTGRGFRVTCVRTSRCAYFPTLEQCHCIPRITAVIATGSQTVLCSRPKLCPFTSSMGKIGILNLSNASTSTRQESMHAQAPRNPGLSAARSLGPAARIPRSRSQDP